MHVQDAGLAGQHQIAGEDQRKDLLAASMCKDSGGLPEKLKAAGTGSSSLAAPDASPAPAGASADAVRCLMLHGHGLWCAIISLRDMQAVGIFLANHHMMHHVYLTRAQPLGSESRSLCMSPPAAKLSLHACAGMAMAFTIGHWQTVHSNVINGLSGSNSSQPDVRHRPAWPADQVQNNASWPTRDNFAYRENSQSCLQICNFHYFMCVVWHSLWGKPYIKGGFS